MNNLIRYAIWAAVSSERQATADKISLELQEGTARQRAVSKGWRETAGPYVVPGETRTRWINLRDAEDAIPQLRQMLDAAQRGEFDVLCIYDYSRLRELIDPVSRALAAYGVQVYSCVQAVDPVSPQIFDGKVTPTSYIVQSISTLTSHTEIDTMMRRLRSGVEGRIPKGLHPSGTVPYGYKHALYDDGGNNAPFAIDPAKAAVVVKIKDLFLAGQTIVQIREYLRENGIRSPRGLETWQDSVVRKVLINPYYAGEVGLGYYRRSRDPRSGSVKNRRGDPEKVSRARGKHEPLWDADTYRAILAEIESRGRAYKGRISCRLSLLMYCAEHQRVMLVDYSHNHRDDVYRLWYCPAGEKGHWCRVIRDTEALELICNKLLNDLSAVETPAFPDQPDKTALLQTALGDLFSRRDRLTDALEAGNLAADVYAERVKSLDLRLVEIRAQLTAAEAAKLDRGRRQDTRDALSKVLEETHDFLTSADPQLVNAQLRTIIQRVLVYADKTIEITYK